ncbi:MAG: lytic transglycosylase domain-containing protein [Nitrospirae bacterium]|nr:lytic transglycosylase domain-containing protein [Nitrospirota bacterium]
MSAQCQSVKVSKCQSKTCCLLPTAYRLPLTAYSLLLTAFFLLPAVVSAFCFEEAGKAYDINHSLLESIAKTESNLTPAAVNRNNNGTEDLGLMQVNSSWIKPLNLNYGLLLSDPCYNVKAGANILRGCIDKYGYTWEAVGCYNAVSAPKRVKYSWKIYNKLAASNKLQATSYKTKEEGMPAKKSEFYFKVVEDKLNSSNNSSLVTRHSLPTLEAQ